MISHKSLDYALETIKAAFVYSEEQIKEFIEKNPEEETKITQIKELKSHYCEMEQKEFGKCFAESIFFEDYSRTEILKYIIADKSNKLRADLTWSYNDKNKEVEKINIRFHHSGKSLLYFLLEEHDFELVEFLLDCLENDERYGNKINNIRGYYKLYLPPPSKKEIKTTSGELKVVTVHNSPVWTKNALVNVGYVTDDSVLFTPLACILMDALDDIKKCQLNIVAIIKQLIKLGAEVVPHGQYNSLKKYSNYGYCEDYEAVLLKRANEFRELFYREDREHWQAEKQALENELKSISHELAILKSENEELRAENLNLRITNDSENVDGDTKKRKTLFFNK